MKKATRALYIEYLTKELEENQEMQHDENLEHAIYIIDDIIVGGGFYDNLRGNDHNCLLEVNYSDNSQYITVNSERYKITWKDLLTWGNVLVPETKTYTSDYIIDELDSLGYTRLLLNNNHIVGIK